MKAILKRIDELFLATLLGIMCVVLILQVVCRYVFNTPLVWSEEVARYLFIWMTMLGLSYNVRKDNNISMQLLVQHFPESVNKIISIIINILAIVLFLCLLPSSIEYLASQMGMRSAALPVSMAVLAFSVPLGFALAVVQHVVRLVSDVSYFLTCQKG